MNRTDQQLVDQGNAYEFGRLAEVVGSPERLKALNEYATSAAVPDADYDRLKGQLAAGGDEAKAAVRELDRRMAGAPTAKGYATEAEFVFGVKLAGQGDGAAAARVAATPDALVRSWKTH